MSTVAPALGRARVQLRLRPWMIGSAVAVLVAGLFAFFPRTTQAFPSSWPAHIGAQTHLDSVNTWVVDNQNTSPLFTHFINYIAWFLDSIVYDIGRVLTWLNWPGVIAIAVLLGLRYGGIALAALAGGGFALMAFLGLWTESSETLALVGASLAISLVIGIPLGILAAGSRRLSSVLRPVLDFMQIMPAFAYLVPVVLLFGIGNAAAIVATLIYAIPPAVRLTELGIRQVPAQVVEAGTAMGSTRWQLLRKVQLPVAKRTIMLGVNQTIMMALAIVVIASLIGAGGLGDPVLQALQTVNVGKAFDAGLAIVIMAIVLDRLSGAASQRAEATGRAGWTQARVRRDRIQLAAGALVVLAVVVGCKLGGVGGFPQSATFSTANPVNSAVNWIQRNITITGTFGTFLVKDLLDPLRNALQGVPWWLVAGTGAALGWLVSGWRLAVGVLAGFFLIGELGLWNDAMDTLSQVIVASAMTIILGVAIGIVAGRSDRFDMAIRPVLDFLQTMPSFVYLIPVVALFAVGRVPGIIASVVYAIPPVIRLTSAGIREVPPNTVEAAVSLGSNRGQLLRKVQLPLARQSIMLGANQGIMLVLAMVIIGGLVGAGALGYLSVAALSRNEFGLGIVVGLTIVLLGIILDRLTQAAAQRGTVPTASQ
jgi:glycine betaine/proline transport system permease protein